MNHLFTLTIAGACLAAPAFADTPACGGPIRFDRGTIHKVVIGELRGYQTCDYTLDARPGQSLRIVQAEGDQTQIHMRRPERGRLLGDYDAVTLTGNGQVTLRVGLSRALARKSNAPRRFGFDVMVLSPGDGGMKAGIDAEWVKRQMQEGAPRG